MMVVGGWLYMRHFIYLGNKLQIQDVLQFIPNTIVVLLIVNTA